ncbi:addiction module protein [Gracilimonas sp. Q87]|uniref:addiction module protein n=1 Tax=Gracilimonas sp. Q87 TaxID=3384766 RepID=UPI0039844D32
MSKKNELLKKALMLKPKEKASMIEALIKSLDAPDEAIDALWKQESESRIDAYEKGALKAVSVQEAFAKYQIDAD